jgi:hypothetical protein
MIEKCQHYFYPDNDTIIWKYLDFSKFVSMLEKKALFFARASDLSDKFEGSFTRADLAQEPESHYISTDVNKIRGIYEENRLYTYINSWHDNPNESMAMWKLYAKNGEGVAIQSTFGALYECLMDTEYKIRIGKVQYIDFDKEKIPGLYPSEDLFPSPDLYPGVNTFTPFIFKWNCYDYEHEVRSVIQDYNAFTENTDNTPPELPKLSIPGEYVPINLEKLINKVWISPFEEDWFDRLVHSVIEKYDINIKAQRSRLAGAPIYSY